MGIAGIEAAFGALHGIGSLPAALLHHDGFDHLHVFRDAVLCRIKLDHGSKRLYFLAHRDIAAAAQEHGSNTHNDNKRNND